MRQIFSGEGVKWMPIKLTILRQNSHSADTYRLRYIRDRVFFLVILNYEIIRSLDSYLSYCFNSA